MARIMRQIEGRPYFLIILTKGSLARCRNEGDWLREELEHAVAVDRVIVPLIITPFAFDEADDALDGFSCDDDSVVEVPANEGLGKVSPDQPI